MKWWHPFRREPTAAYELIDGIYIPIDAQLAARIARLRQAVAEAQMSGPLRYADAQHEFILTTARRMRAEQHLPPDPRLASTQSKGA